MSDEKVNKQALYEQLITYDKEEAEPDEMDEMGVYPNVTLLVDMGKHKSGSTFAMAEIHYFTSEIRLYGYDNPNNTVVLISSFSLKITVV